MNAFLYYTLAAAGIYWLSIGLLFFASRSVPACGFYARSLIGWGVLMFCALYGTLASIVLLVVGKQGLSQWTTARSFKWSMRLAMGVKFVLQDEEHLQTRPAVIIGNHQTELDVAVLGTVFPKYCVVTSKRSLQWVPFLGWFMALSGTVFIDRANAKSARSAFDSAANRIRSERTSVFIFPEGTRSHTTKPELLPFKKGAFHLAVQAQVPIVPVVVANYSYVLHMKTRTFRPGTIPVKVLPPIETKGLKAEDVEELTNSTRELMLKELVKVTEQAHTQGLAIDASKAAKVDDATTTGADTGKVRAR